MQAQRTHSSRARESRIQNILGLQPEFFSVLKLVAEKEDAFGFCKTASARQGIALVRIGQARRHTERQAFIATQVQ